MWNDRYADAFHSYGKEANDFLRSVAPTIPTGRVLCLAEGEGRNAVFLAERGLAVHAVDLSEVGLRNARSLAKARGVHIETTVADLADYDLGENAWSAIVSIWAHVPVPIRERLHRACVRALKPGGVFILEAYTPEQLAMPGVGGPPNADLLMDPDALQAELEGLQIERCERTERDIQEGRYHRGMSSTVQVLARRPV